MQETEEENIGVILEQLKRILFNNPNNKKFVITNLSDKISHFRKFEKEVCPIEKVLTFQKPIDISSQNTYIEILSQHKDVLLSAAKEMFMLNDP